MISKPWTECVHFKHKSMFVCSDGRKWRQFWTHAGDKRKVIRKINTHVKHCYYLYVVFALVCTGGVASIIAFWTPPKRSLVLVQCDTTLMKSDTRSTDCSINHHLPPPPRYICMLALTLQSAPPLPSQHLWWEAGGPGGGGQRIRRRTEPPSSPAAPTAKPYKGAKLSVLIHSRLLSPTSGTLKRHLC